MLLAGLSETRAGEPAVARTSAGERDRRWWFALKQKTGDARLYPHSVHLPKDYDRDPAKRWPLLVFLHGSGERGESLQMVKQHGPPKLADTGRDLPFVIVTPQCPPGE